MINGNSGMQGKGERLDITRIFNAPPDLVFRLWSEPEHMARWSCPKDFTTTLNEGDVRPGGNWRMCMRSPAGQDYCLQGTYWEIMAPERILFTHAWEDAEGKPLHETQVTVCFTEVDGKTRQTFRQAGFESAASRDSHEAGWNECFDKEDAYLSQLTRSG